MEIVTLKQYKTPHYPIKDEIINSDILLNKLPKRWNSKILPFTSISAALLLTLSACQPVRTAGVNIAPRISLSEEDALIIINDEAKNYGITFEYDKTEIQNVDIPYKQIYNLNTNGTIEEETFETKKGNLILDGYVQNSKIGFEYVSDTDIDQWAADDSQQSLNGENKNIANNLSSSIKNADKEKKIGVFYDPHAVDMTEAKTQLRNQVRNFINWLKAEGVI